MLIKPYVFNIEAKPHPDNPQAKGLAGASVNIWVFADSMDSARDSAFRYIDDYGWSAIKVVIAAQPTPEQISRLDAHEACNYRKAEQMGICAEFGAWPENPRPGVYSFEPLQKPQK